MCFSYFFKFSIYFSPVKIRKMFIPLLFYVKLWSFLWLYKVIVSFSSLYKNELSSIFFFHLSFDSYFTFYLNENKQIKGTENSEYFFLLLQFSFLLVLKWKVNKSLDGNFKLCFVLNTLTLCTYLFSKEISKKRKF